MSKLSSTQQNKNETFFDIFLCMSGINLRINILSKHYFNENNSEFARKVGTNEANIRNYCKNTMPKFDFIERLFEFFPEISHEWLITGKGEMLKAPGESQKVPEVIESPNNNDGYRPYYDVDFECGFDLIENNQTIQPTSYIKFPQYNKAEMWVNVYGKSMEPLISPGDIIAIRELQDWNSYLLYGEVYAIVTREYRTIKIIRKSIKENYLKLVPINTKECDEQEIPKELVTRVFQVIGTAKRFI